MPDRPLDFDNTGSTAKTLSQLPPTEAEKSEYKAKLAQILERGLVIDMLQVDLPDHLRGQWVSKTGGFVERMQLLGYQVDTEHAPKKSVHDQGDGSAGVSDVIFMVIPTWKKEMQDTVIKQRYYETHIKDRRKGKEERDYESINRGLNMPTTIASDVEEVDGVRIEETLQKG